MDPLAQLQDIHVPDHISLWPLAWGWWAIIALVVIGSALSCYLFLRYRRIRKIRELALHELQTIDPSSPDCLNSLNTLLKRTCMQYFGSNVVASLYGDSWRRFLTSLLKEKHQSKFETQFAQMQESMYAKQPYSNSVEAITTVREWLNLALPPKPNKYLEAQQHV